MTHADRLNLQAHGVDPALTQKMTHFAPLTLPEIVELSKHGVLPEEIIQYLHATHYVYTISDADGYHLNGQGVNPTVITYLFATPDLMARASDRTRFFDWAPYYVPTYGGMMNTFADEDYGSQKSYFGGLGKSSDATLQKQQSEQQKILGPQSTQPPAAQPPLISTPVTQPETPPQPH
jgi:hypothetical protein